MQNVIHCEKGENKGSLKESFFSVGGGGMDTDGTH